MPEEKYVEQYNRMKRFYERIKLADEGWPEEEGWDSHRYQDNLLSFFLHCFHLFDWIQYDDATQLGESELDSFVRTTDCLSLCADICNATKHLGVDDNGWSEGARPSPDEGTGHITMGENLTATFSIPTENGDVDAFDLATECVEEWDEFLEGHSLVTDEMT